MLEVAPWEFQTHLECIKETLERIFQAQDRSNHLNRILSDQVVRLEQSSKLLSPQKELEDCWRELYSEQELR